jgi:putative transposase
MRPDKKSGPSPRSNRNAGSGPARTPGGVEDPDSGKIGSKGTLPHRLRRLRFVWARDPYARYYLTICVEGRRRVLANKKIDDRVVAFLLDSPKRYQWWPRWYVLMPDHLHLIVHEGHNAIELGLWVKALKRLTAQREFKWEEGFFDHVLRSNESETKKCEYIYQNPVRAGLVARPEDWPYGGRIVYDKNGPRVLRGRSIKL